MNESHDSFKSLLCRFLEEDLSESETDHFVSLLKEDPARVAELKSQLQTSDLLSRIFDDKRSEESFTSSTEVRLQQSDGQAHEFVESVIGQLPGGKVLAFPWPRWALAAAACVALLFAAFNLGTQTETPPVATMATIAFASDDAAHYIESVEKSAPFGQTIEYAAGLMRLDFINGAIVTIEGPASFVIENGMHISLQKGTLNAWCPDSAHGFAVTTPDAEIVDLGTSFGIAAGEHSSDVTVFDGEVVLDQSSYDSGSHLLLKGDSMRATPESGIVDIAFDGSPFQNTWPLTSGIVNTHGSVHSSPPDIPSQLYTYESDENLIVFPERRNLQLTEDIPIEFRGAGKHELVTGQPKKIFKAKPQRRFRSYLLHYNPVGGEKNSPLRNFRGSVSFDNRIVAVLATTQSLASTDSLFMEKEIVFSKSRGLESGNGKDKIIISEDRKTLDVDFYANSQVDQIRVIVAEAREKDVK